MVRAGRHSRRWIGAVLTVGMLTGCGHGPAGAGESGPASAGTFDPTTATAILTAFDHADSAASSAGELGALAAQETSPALDASVASVRRTKATNRTQPAFRHVDPVFAIPAGSPSCFLAVATLTTVGAELTRTDVSQFVRTDDNAWKLSHNIQIGPAEAPTIRTAGGRPAAPSTTVIDNERRARLSAEVFARTIATGTPDLARVGTSVLLDKQFAAGWQVYQQQMATAKMAVTRTLSGADWSACAVTLDRGTVTFLTLHVTDTIQGQPGVPATLDPRSPDLVGLGQSTAVTGTTIAISRVEVVLLLVPADASAATVLGLNDAPTAISATP